jgi:hypothetical protein
VQLRSGAPPDGGLFVAGLPGPFPAATDVLAVSGRDEGAWATLGPGLLVLTRVLSAVGLIVLAGGRRTGAPSGVSPVRWVLGHALGLTVLYLVSGIMAVVAGLLGGALLAVLVLLAAGAVWAGVAARAAGRAGGRRGPLAAVVAGGIALLLTPAGPVPEGDALALAALGGTEGAVLLLAALHLGPARAHPRRAARERVPRRPR